MLGNSYQWGIGKGYLPSTKWIRSAAPAVEPVSIEEARWQCNLQGNEAHDAGLNRLIQTAREKVERDAGIACYTGTYTSKRTVFPYDDWFELPDLQPITAVGSITYVDNNGSTTTWSSAEYSLDIYGVVPVVKLGYPYLWPILRGDVNGITITVTAGNATQALIPAQVKQACLLLISHWFEYRGAVLTGTSSKEIELAYGSLIESLERKSYA